ncbi:peptidylprolyl isomerase [Meridianimaribacter flavus]|uniref:peptidylprolyl isomerase n=1 Tax=Meridianimaribacter flavus TaxID=571115 RepID=A0ABY2G4N0_9FLAO|nr:peptidylprolyl isomerase [Meridianimaribacter flavus]TDY11430.1 peptidyl-prolyl cis-trans isomerase B (cyclophilin B) [Meridianimaribacter flavus]
MKNKNVVFVLFSMLMCLGCNSKPEKKKIEDTSNTIVVLTTNYGEITLELFNDTPKHRDNFIKLVNEHAYDSLLFHRVIKDFVIQGGDPDSKNAPLGKFLGEGDLDYTVPAEFRPNLFHKRGALATAREENLTRASSAMQFFIVDGKVYNDSLLDVAQQRINTMTARYHVIKSKAHKPLFEALKIASEGNDEQLATKLNDSIQQLAETYTDFEAYTIPEAHRAVYKSIGGIPHLDQNYTVFGEVIEGMNVVDSIVNLPTDENDRPLENVIILSTELKN